MKRGPARGRGRERAYGRTTRGRRNSSLVERVLLQGKLTKGLCVPRRERAENVVYGNSTGRHRAAVRTLQYIPWLAMSERARRFNRGCTFGPAILPCQIMNGLNDLNFLSSRSSVRATREILGASVAESLISLMRYQGSPRCTVVCIRHRGRASVR